MFMFRKSCLLSTEARMNCLVLFVPSTEFPVIAHQSVASPIDLLIWHGLR